MMRRRVFTTAVALAGLCSAPSVASAQSCSFPKGWSTGLTQLQYDASSEAVFVTNRPMRYIPAPGSDIDMPNFLRRAPRNGYDLAVGTATSGYYLVDALGRFVTTVATSTVNEPPSCSTGH